jgi:hypothetical protein
MRRAAQTDRRLARGSVIGSRRARNDDGERAGPERVDQSLGDRRHRRREAGRAALRPATWTISGWSCMAGLSARIFATASSRSARAGP